MTIFDFLKLHRDLFTFCRRVGLRLNDVKYIDLFRDYSTLLQAGNKITYIVAVLAQRYHISVRKVYGLLKRFKNDCNFPAV